MHWCDHCLWHLIQSNTPWLLLQKDKLLPSCPDMSKQITSFKNLLGLIKKNNSALNFSCQTNCKILSLCIWKGTRQELRDYLCRKKFLKCKTDSQLPFSVAAFKMCWIIAYCKVKNHRVNGVNTYTSLYNKSPLNSKQRNECICGVIISACLTWTEDSVRNMWTVFLSVKEKDKDKASCQS